MVGELSGTDRIVQAIRASAGPAICVYVTAGYPDLGVFPDILRSVAGAADLVEIGVPFTDPMADGLTIQTANRQALAAGVTLAWILDVLDGLLPELEAPVLLMGYYNPFLVYGLDRLADRMSESGVAGVVVPDLPFEESGPMERVLTPRGIALIRLVAPTTPEDRLRQLARSSTGFTYAVTTTGVTGGRAELPEGTLRYLAKVRGASNGAVLAGFGIRSQSQVTALAPHVEGVVVGSALLEVIGSGEDPGRFIEGLRRDEVPA